MKEEIIHRIKNLFFGSIIFILLFPAFQKHTGIIPEMDLKGAITKLNKPDFSLHDWFEAVFQEKMETYMNESFGLRSYFVRIHNQLAYTFFRKAKANGVIIGKQKYLYEKNYIKAYYGLDFIGEDSILHRMRRIKFLQDTLEKLNKHIIIVFAAGKGSFYPEYFPDKYKTYRKETNYEYHLKYADTFEINYIDFNQYFIDHKNISPYPLYPKHGIHWSIYGACLVADSIIQYIEEKTGYQFADFAWDTIKIQKAAGVDYDIADGMNLVFKLRRQKMAYPEFYIKNDSGKFKPSLLVISDSFYWVIYGLGFANAFSQNQFWFYNKDINPKSLCSPTETRNECLRNEIARHDVIIIMATEATLPSFGWGFIEEACEVFDYDNAKITGEEDSAFRKKVTDLVNYIKTDEKWYSLIRKKAAEKNIPVDSMLVIDAIWLLQQKTKK